MAEEGTFYQGFFSAYIYQSFGIVNQIERANTLLVDARRGRPDGGAVGFPVGALVGFSVGALVGDALGQRRGAAPRRIEVVVPGPFAGHARRRPRSCST